MTASRTLHTARLFYFFYFAVMGLVLPFFPVYLASLQMEAFTIGLIIALISAARIFAPPLFGYWLEQRQYNPAIILCLSSLVAAMALLPLNSAATYLPVFALLVLLFALLWSGILAPADSLTIRIAEANHTHYSRIRLWGSVGFIVSSLLAGSYLAGERMLILPWIMAGLMIALAISSVTFQRMPVFTHHPSDDAPLPHSRETHRLMLAGLLMQCSHGAYYAFFSLYLIHIGYQAQWVSLFWVVSVVAEIILMAWAGHWLQRCSLALCLHICFVLAAVRWLGIAYSEAWWWLLLWQLFHAATFGAFHISSITAMNRMVAPSRQASAQGWLGAMTFGLGGMSGVMLAGWLVQVIDIRAALLSSSIIALLGAWLYRQPASKADTHIF
ncbi:MAG: MFS transporter [Mariprofundaceae bacterium]|nr:MFS transporter [Mariprofundaceae bacterium]